MKTILLVECVPRKLKFSLAPHPCVTLREAGLAGKKNGELLALADGKFDVLVTVDKSVCHQQSMTGRTIAVLVIRAKGNSMPYLSSSCGRLYGRVADHSARPNR